MKGSKANLNIYPNISYWFTVSILALFPSVIVEIAHITSDKISLLLKFTTSDLITLQSNSHAFLIRADLGAGNPLHKFVTAHVPFFTIALF